jgi:DNA-binding ferritin-like protein
VTAPTDTATPTAEDFLDQAAERLEALCAMPMTPAEFALSRIAAQHQAALREIVAHIPTDPDRRTP